MTATAMPTAISTAAVQAGKTPSPDAPRVEDVSGDATYYCDREDKEKSLLEAAREKYNENTINIIWDGDALDENKLNVIYYYGGENGEYINISIPDSLTVSNKYEMAAVVETIIRNENYSKDLFGTREHMVAQWIAHNLTYDIVTIENTPETVERIISTMSGSNTLEESSKKLDLRQIGNTLKRQDLIYALLEFAVPEE